MHLAKYLSKFESQQGQKKGMCNGRTLHFGYMEDFWTIVCPYVWNVSPIGSINLVVWLGWPQLMAWSQWLFITWFYFLFVYALKFHLCSRVFAYLGHFTYYYIGFTRLKHPRPHPRV